MHILSMLILALGAAATLLLAIQASDAVMSFHAGLMALFFVVGIVLVQKRRNNLTNTDGYEDGIIRAGAIASTFWGVVGFLVGLVIALQLAFPVLNFDLPWTNFGRLRPLHTSAVIFAFGGNILLMTSFHVVQRTCQARLAGGDRKSVV